jgi:VWFA-related protein
VRCAALSVAVFALALAAPAAAQSSDSGDFEMHSVERLDFDDVEVVVVPDPAVSLYLRAETHLGTPVEHLRPVDLTIAEDGRPVDPKTVTLTPLGETNRGLAGVLALDVSRTMQGEALDQAKAGALAFLDRLGPADRIAILSFGGKVDVVAPFSKSRAEARERLSTLEVDASSLRTLLYDGMYRAVELVRQGGDLPRRAFVILLSDSQDGGSVHKLDDAIALAQGDGSRAQVPIFTIGYANFGRGGLQALQRVAKETGGDFVEAANPSQMAAFYDHILSQMTKSYVARFTPELDGKTHRIEVSAGGLKQARAVLYPLYRRPVWPIAVGAAGTLLAMGLLAWLTLRRRPAGRLVFVAGPRAGEGIMLRPGRIRIGSLPDNDLSIPSSTVSRYHAEIHVAGRRVSIEDLRSSNGTQVNGTVVQMSPLRPGDRIKIADIDLVFER